MPSAANKSEKRMKLYADEIFVCLDCETTGLDAQQDRIIEVAVVSFNAKSNFDEYESLVKPDCEIPESSIAIHHITPDMVEDKPSIEQVLPDLLKTIGNRIIVGHGIALDIEFIANAAQRAKVPTTIRDNKFIDTLRLARHYGESPVNSLEQLRKHFNIEDEGAHRAMSDVIVNMDVFRYLANRFKYVEQIFEQLSKPAMLKIMPLGPHKGRPMKEIPIEYLHWASKKKFDQDLTFSIRYELNRRKKGNLFSQATNPFSTL